MSDLARRQLFVEHTQDPLVLLYPVLIHLSWLYLNIFGVLWNKCQSENVQVSCERNAWFENYKSNVIECPWLLEPIHISYVIIKAILYDQLTQQQPMFIDRGPIFELFFLFT